ncbi:hypothetical protein B0J13DRAFT_190136 [Dactylonectria estremocensis]|uniref:Uncharacterized protein n=1 Tax=Dactylonectria estremocensis TaxID=1079267 RepID=A0A9P9FCE7_9HYPO|nr:hypothetical protein B0J13DRAFT_190136 [Dactylonectria estremocensis]
MRTQGIKSGFGASSHLSTSNKDLHEFLTAYVRDVECKWTPDYLGPIVEAMNHVIREKPRLPLQTSHMSITKTIEHGMVCEKICIVVTAPGGKGYLVVQLPPRDTVDKLNMIQLCTNINDVANRLSPNIWRSLRCYERNVVLFTAIGGYSDGAIWFTDGQMSIKEKQTLHESMGVQNCDIRGVTQAHSNQDTANPCEDYVSGKKFAELQEQVDILAAKVDDLVNSVSVNKAPAPDLASRDTAPRDRSDLNNSWTNAMLQTTQPRQESTCDQDRYLANPYLPPGSHGMGHVNAEDPFSSSQSQMPVFLDRKMPGSWVPEPMAPSGVGDARDTKRKEKANTTKTNCQNAFNRDDWSFAAAQSWDTKCQCQEDTWGHEDTPCRKDPWDQGNIIPTKKHNHRQTYANSIDLDYTGGW